MADVPFFAGRKGSEFIIRQLAPGANDANPSFNQIVFDSRGYPGRVLGTGEFFCGGADVAGYAIGTSVYYYLVLGEKTVPHGLGVTPTHVIATAIPEREDGSPEIWHSWQGVDHTPAQLARTEYGGEAFGKKLCSAFHIEYRYETQGARIVVRAGWRYTWNSTDIKAITYLCSKTSGNINLRLRVRWTALEI
ncbi:hypothetical protein [Enterovirga rhinocerotis]|uniref:Uncharacterized protein n=1 Tax=Enterovirga rhinocerotis TaxID=1339210 RepID=A0A4R7BXH2_9HYPH|nr:hypothetical protein [Enterovirga rhinocerotis]TDR90281.1 hypothetical protein EV668_3127 [Enterovirga rhinocerotis]